jgi:hypothetical protein
MEPSWCDGKPPGNLHNALTFRQLRDRELNNDRTPETSNKDEHTIPYAITHGTTSWKHIIHCLPRLFGKAKVGRFVFGEITRGMLFEIPSIVLGRQSMIFNIQLCQRITIRSEVLVLLCCSWCSQLLKLLARYCRTALRHSRDARAFSRKVFPE